MSGLDYQYGAPIDYYERFLPYEIPGEIPTYDPALFKTSRMQQYHDSFPQQQDSALSELAALRELANKPYTTQAPADTPSSDNPLFRMIDNLAAMYGGFESSDIPGLLGYIGSQAWRSTGIPQTIGMLREGGHPSFVMGPRGQVAIDARGLGPEGKELMNMAASGGILPATGMASAPLNRSVRSMMKGVTRPAATETLSARAPLGGNRWIRQVAPGDIRESPDVLRQVRAKNLRARNATSSTNDALDQVMQNPREFSQWLERAEPQPTPMEAVSRPDKFSSVDISGPVETPPEITGLGLNYRLDRQGRRRVLPDENIRGSYSQYTGPTKNTEGFWEDITSPARKAYDFLNNDVAEAVNALMRSPGEMAKYGSEVARNLGGSLGAGAKAAAEDLWSQGAGPLGNSILNKATDIAQRGIKAGRRAGILDEEPRYYVRNKSGDWGQADWYNAMPSEQKSAYNALPQDWRRTSMALKERDLPALSDFVDRHPFATIGGGALTGATLIADRIASALGAKPGPMQTSLSDILPSSQPGKPSWWSNYDFLWGG